MTRQICTMLNFTKIILEGSKMDCTKTRLHSDGNIKIEKVF